MARVAAPVAPISNIEPDAKLALVEFLLTSVNVQESARRAIDWLVGHVSVTEAAVLVVEGAGTEVLLVAEHGISSGAIMDFSLARDDSRHPLVEALSGAETVYIQNLASHHRVLSNRGRPRDPAARRREATVVWTAPRRGHRSGDGRRYAVARPHARQARVPSARAPGAGRDALRQERMLLYSIINAVTDPILLTDTEGKLIIGNSHAESCSPRPRRRAKAGAAPPR